MRSQAVIRALLILFLLAGSAYGLQVEGPSSLSELPARPAEVSVSRGRAVLVHGDVSDVIFASTGPVEIHGRVHLELSAGAELSITWATRASLRLSGPASIEWEAASISGAGQPLELSFFMAHEANLEVRRHGAEIQLPNSWHLALERSALRLASTIDGAFILSNDAGRFATATWMGDEGRARPPVDLAPGETFRLGPIEEFPVPPDISARVKPWTQVDWPWPVERVRWVPIDGGDELRVTVTPANSSDADWGKRGEHGPLQSVSAKPAMGAGAEAIVTAVEIRGAELPVSRKIVEEDPPQYRGYRLMRLPFPMGPVAVSPSQAEGDESRLVRVVGPFEPSAWRFVAREELRGLDEFAYQLAPELEVMELLGHRHRFSLAANAESNVWIFGETEDALLFPGAVLIVSREGGFESHYGRLSVSGRLEMRGEFGGW